MPDMLKQLVSFEMNEDAIEELKKNPDIGLAKFRSVLNKLATQYKPRTATQGSNLSDDPSRFSLEKAVGGTIPNSFNKLGISSIRRV